ncbi:minor tail protein Gp27 [Rhodococcus triatomae BKS 15-14]|nr:minor tail protein Gp27 [Rhodococcus triatomae BKS 15-14]
MWILDRLKGFYLPPAERLTSTTANQIGSTPRKTVQNERILEMLICTTADTTDDHDKVESDWWSGLSLEQAGRLEATADGKTRWLDVILKEYPNDTWILGPDINNYQEHDMRLVACNPAFQGGTRSVEVTGSGTFNITVSNPTDRPMWLNFVGTAGTWKIPDGLSSRMVTLPALAEGWKLWTDPQVRSLEVDSGAPVWPSVMKGVTFTKAIPPHTKKTLIHPQIVSGSGTLRVEMVDQYSRPWG